MRFRIIGPGRAGGSFSGALISIGWEAAPTLGRGDDLSEALDGADVVLLCVPDGAVARVAALVEPGEAVIVHVAGSLGLDVLGSHRRVGSVHPLMTLPDPERGAERLLDNCSFAVAGDPVTGTIAEVLGGRAFTVDDDRRRLYHATAAVASNHLVALTAQVERLAAAAGVPADAFWPLMTTSLANATTTGPAAALTGPAARADWATVRGHLNALHPISDGDVECYLALAAQAAALAGHELPEDIR